MKGNFVVQRIESRFSIMAKDQSHEHSNGYTSGNGGDSGQDEEPMPLLTRILASHQRARILLDYEKLMLTHQKLDSSIVYT